MLGLFNIFGRSDALKALDLALRKFDVHPRLVPEAAKLATLRLMQKASEAAYTLGDPDYEKAAGLLGYCILGPDQFVASNTLAAGTFAEQRVEAAIDAGDSLDAELILLALHAEILHPDIADRFEVEANE